MSSFDLESSSATSHLNRENSQNAKPVSLRRSVGLPEAIALLVGTIIGSGIFATPKWVLLYVGSVGMSLVMWTVCGLIALSGALCYCELGTLISKSGGEYAYLMEAYGPLPAFLCSYIYVLFVKPSMIMVLLVFGAYVSEPFFPGCGDSEHLVPLVKILAAAALGVITFVNCASVKWATRMQIVFTAAKMIAIVMLIVTGLVRLGQGYTSSLTNGFEGTSWNIGKLSFAFYNGLFPYDGWNQLNFFTEEIKNPNRNIPLSIWMGIPLITICYLLVNIGYITVLTPQEIVNTDAVAVILANRLYGVMAWTIPILVACSTFGTANANVFAGGRLVFSAAREGHLPKFLAMIHTKRRTPLPAVVFSSIISLLMLIPDSTSFESLLNYFSFFGWLSYGLTISSVIWFRYKRPNDRRPYKVWIGIPIFMVLISAYLVIAPIYEAPLESLFCVLFLLSGIPLYLIFVRYKKVPVKFLRFVDRVTFKLQKICDVVFPENEDDFVSL
ncbi:b(0,+)-type amino acid transporter 1-like isoform X1 [Porites lutea]|uniref:b(0,+)-type amino acid transporter 1-like isoform X1 n=1 Tax=Porites lutea TaxID=51062 RepID=UPI003CC61273